MRQGIGVWRWAEEGGCGRVRQELFSDIPRPQENGEQHQIARHLSMKVKGSFEVEEFSSSKYPEADISVVEDHGGPKPYQFELLVAGLQCPKLEISLCFSLTPSGTVLPAATIVRPCDGLKGNTAVLWHFDSSQTYRTSPNHCAKF